MLYFNQFYRKYGTRKIANFVKPVTMDAKTFIFPIDSIIHWIKVSDIVNIPTKEFGYLNRLSGRLYVESIFNYPDMELVGKFRHLNSNAMTIINQMVHAEKSFKFIKPSMQHVSMQHKDMILVNYGSLNHMYKYAINPLNEYYKYHNVMSTVINHSVVEKYVANRNIFLTIDLPPKLPTRQKLDLFLHRFTRTTFNTLTDYRYFNLLEFWKYLTPEFKEQSVFSKIPADKQDKINFLLSIDNKVVMLNLKVLTSIVLEYNTDTYLAKLAKYKASTIRKLFYLFIYRIIHGKYESYDTIANDKDDKDVSIVASGVIEGAKPGEDGVDLDRVIDQTVIERDDEDNSNTDEQKEYDANEDEVVEETENATTTSSEINNAIENTSISKNVNTVEELYNVGSITNEKISTELATLKEANLISKNEHTRLLEVISVQHKIPSPYEHDKIKTGELLDSSTDIYKISTEDFKTSDTPAVFDKEYNTNTVSTIDKHYIKNQMKKDIVRTVYAFQNANSVVEDYKVVTNVSVLGETESHEFKLSTLNGRQSSVKLVLPKIQEDGTFKLSGNNYRLRKQRVDKPIRKIDSNMVALTSHYGKIFISKATYKKNDLGYWIRREFVKKYQEENSKLKNLVLIQLDNVDCELPIHYNLLSRYIKSFTYGKDYFSFDYEARKKIIKDMTDDKLADLEENDLVLVGSRGNTPLLMGKSNSLFILENNKYKDIGDIFDLVELDINKGPIEYTNIRIYREQFPVGLLLSYYLGFESMLKLFKPTYRIEEVGKRISVRDYVITFKNKTYVFQRSDLKTDMIFYGLSTLNDTLVKVNAENLNVRSKFSTIFTDLKLSVLYINEIKLLDEMFIDPMTLTILKELKLPINFPGLLIKATELLEDDNYKNPNNITEMSIKGYERVSGMMYHEIVSAVKEHRNRSFFSRSKITIDPLTVIRKINEDSTTVLIDDLNPMAYIKQTEDLTYLGQGGRSKDGMSRDTREMHTSEIGIVSEASKDSGDVGISAYMSANPNIDNTRGILKDFNIEDHGFASILSSSAMLAPFAINEDMKRLNFVNIMNSHVIPIANMRAPYIRTGYETIVPIKADGKFVRIAKENGTVTNVTNKAVDVTYVSGKKETIQLTSWTTKEESGACYTHTMITSLNKGDTLIKDDTLSYVDSFFEPDIFNPKRVIYKAGTYVNVALLEDMQTYEDSAAISTKMNKELGTTVTKVKSTVVNTSDAILDIKLKGTKLEPNDVLFTITDGALANIKNLDLKALSILQDIKNISPKAKIRGVISKIVVYYNCEIEELSTTLKELVRISDENLKRETGYTGRVTSAYSIQGTPLLEGKVEIKMYIQVADTMGIGDKAIIGNQLKFTVGEVFDYNMNTLDGKEIDLVFSNKSIKGRIVNSPELIGTTSTLLSVITDIAVNEYFA